MTVQKGKIYRQFKDHILECSPEGEQVSKDIITEVLAAVEGINLVNEVEPGVAIIESLKDEIQHIIKEATDKKISLCAVVHALVIGAFKTSQVVEDEAHATIGLLARYIIRSTAMAGGDAGFAARGLIAGVMAQAEAGKLNVDAAASEAATNAYYEAKAVGPEAEAQVKGAVKQKIKGVEITIYEQHPKKKTDINPPHTDEK